MGIPLAEETQLLAEEKWITEALNKIKCEKNKLRIERLHLESMKTQLEKAEKKVQIDDELKEETSDIPTTSVLDIMQNVSNICMNMYETQNTVMQDEACNFEELNLNVSNSIFDNEMDKIMQMEEDEDDDEDNESCDNVILDMDMLMNAQ